MSRMHSVVVREADGTHTIVTDGAIRKDVTGFRSREEALIYRSDLRRAVAAQGTWVHLDGCCA